MSFFHGFGSVLLGGVFTLLSSSVLHAETSDRPDWLLDSSGYVAKVETSADGKEVVLTNGLIRRTFRVAPNAATVAIDNLMTGESMLRSVRPEATLEIEGEKYAVGGLIGQPIHNYLLPEWIEGMKSDPAAFQFVGFEKGTPTERLPWKRVRYHEDRPWPPKGVALTLKFKAPEKIKSRFGGDVFVEVRYELYDGIPVMCKQIVVRNAGEKELRLNRFTSEILAFVEPESVVDARNAKDWLLPNVHIETDYSFAGMDSVTATRAVHWVPDPLYQTQVHYEKQMPCLLECRPPLGPNQIVGAGKSFASFFTFELFHDSYDRERQGLAQRRMYRTIAPWATENPILMHVRSADPASVKKAIDQCAEVGFEMVILTFGSGFNIENPDPKYLESLKELNDYAKSKNVELGGYSLLASRRVSDADDVINPKTGKIGGAIFGNSPCIGSRWGQTYFEKLYAFYPKTGFSLLEHDGSYPGDLCASTQHPGHKNLDDSQWNQWRTITDFYHWARGQGIYLNVPDFYFLSGSNKTGMGYRETNWSLPRAQQEIIERQNVFDGTWTKTPSMGWMFVPLTEYHGGGAAATIEPLAEHLEHYETRLANLFGAGVQACYRGPRLYDTDATKNVVKKWVDFYKKHRAILDSDLLHLRRADGRDLDYILHVNPQIAERGLLMVYNPTDAKIERKIPLPLYYTGLTESAKIRERENDPKTFKLDRQFRVELPISVEPRSRTWYVIEAP